MRFGRDIANFDCSSGETDYVFKHQTISGEFVLDTLELKQTLEYVPLNHPEIQLFRKEILQGNLEQIHISE